ncbi:hypothetical protein ACLOJK_019602 [Asimina triloba]
MTMDPSASNLWDGGERSDAAASFSDLLNFASRAQTLISQLLLLSSRIPNQFRDSRFDPVLFDLRKLTAAQIGGSLSAKSKKIRNRTYV